MMLNRFVINSPVSWYPLNIRMGPEVISGGLLGVVSKLIGLQMGPLGVCLKSVQVARCCSLD